MTVLGHLFLEFFAQDMFMVAQGEVQQDVMLPQQCRYRVQEQQDLPPKHFSGTSSPDFLLCRRIGL